MHQLFACQQLELFGVASQSEFHPVAWECGRLLDCFDVCTTLSDSSLALAINLDYDMPDNFLNIC